MTWCLVGLGSFCLLSWGIFSARRILYPTPHPSGPPEPLPNHTTHILTAPDGTSFNVWRLAAPSPRARLLICHGYYANHYQVFGLAGALRQRGFEVLLFELRGHGQRRGPCTFGLNECADAQVVLDWAAQQESSPLPVGLLGWSMGGALMCYVAARTPSIRAIVVDSGYSRLFPVIARAIRERHALPQIPFAYVTWWGLEVALRTRLGALDPAELAPHLTQPLLAIRGGADQRVPPPFAREWYERWAGPKERWDDPTAVHVGIFTAHPGEYCQRVTDFFNRYCAR